MMTTPTPWYCSANRLALLNRGVSSLARQPVGPLRIALLTILGRRQPLRRPNGLCHRRQPREPVAGWGRWAQLPHEAAWRSVGGHLPSRMSWRDSGERYNGRTSVLVLRRMNARDNRSLQRIAHADRQIGFMMGPVKIVVPQKQCEIG